MTSAEGPVISTHVLDTTTGDPARDVPVTLERLDAEGWHTVARGRTDGDGRLRWPVAPDDRRPGDFRLLFAVAAYLGDDAFFPEVTVTFRVRDPRRGYHVPLLLSRYGYTTYRGS